MSWISKFIKEVELVLKLFTIKGITIKLYFMINVNILNSIINCKKFSHLHSKVPRWRQMLPEVDKIMFMWP